MINDANDPANRKPAPLSITKVLQDSARTFFANFLVLAIVCWVSGAPILLDVLIPSDIVFGQFIATFISIPLILTASAYVVVTYLAGRPVSIGACFKFGLQRWFSVFFGYIIILIILSLGTLLLIIPGLYLSVVLAVALQSLTVEKSGIFGCLNRSSDLTIGNRWNVLGFLVIFFIAIAVILTIALFISIPVLFAYSVVIGVNAAVAVLTWVLWPMMMLPAPIMYAVAYRELRLAWQSDSSDAMADAFD